MKLVILIFGFYFKILALIIQGMFYMASVAVTLITSIVQGILGKRQVAARRTVTKISFQSEKAAAAARKAEIAENVGYAFSEESESYFNLGNALEDKAKRETDNVKRAKLRQQAATAYRKAEQLASKSPSYLAH